MVTGGAIRVFIAVDISDAACWSLSSAMDGLKAAIPRGVRWVDPRGIHLTLKFLGNIEPRRVDGILESMVRVAQEVSSFSLTLAGLGVFPNQRQPRVLWAGVAGDMDPLAGVQLGVEEAMAEQGFTKERRSFNPHLTIGRVRDGVSASERQKIGNSLTSCSLESTESWMAETMHLFQTTFTPDGSIHDIIGSAPLLRPHG
jgi:2'-5' RNA ligase